MDSITQIVLGAAVADASIGARVGRRAALYGAVLGTLPDLDVFVPLGGVVEDFIYHRSASHSLFVLTLLSPVLAWLIHRWHGPPHATFRRWLLTVWLVLITHPLLDVFTIYGTQLLWPISDYPFGAGSVFIIDPVFTVPLALGLLAALILRRQRRLGAALNAAGMAFGVFYLGFGLLAQAHVRSFAHSSLLQQKVNFDTIEVLAAPFTSLAWRVVAVDDDDYYVAYHSLLSPARELRLMRFQRESALLDSLGEVPAVRQLSRFTKGLFTIAQHSGDIYFSDLRMGHEPDRFAFTFVVGQRRDGRIAPVPARRVQGPRFRDGDWSRLVAILGGAARL